MWLILHIQKDKVEHYDLVKNICMHIRPEAYYKQDENVVASTTFAEDIEQKLGRKLSSEEKLELGFPEEDTDFDTIERM